MTLILLLFLLELCLYIFGFYVLLFQHMMARTLRANAIANACSTPHNRVCLENFFISSIYF